MSVIEHQSLPATDRAALRARLRQARRDFLAGPTGDAAIEALQLRLDELLRQLEPVCLGIYWPLAGEFDAPALLPEMPGVQLALPFSWRDGRLDYRRWSGGAPTTRDEMGIPACEGARCEPDLVLVPCLGYTREAYRIGYGGGYFDRWLAANPGVTAVGLAWSVTECEFDRAAHDLALSLVLTERELIAP